MAEDDLPSFLIEPVYAVLIQFTDMMVQSGDSLAVHIANEIEGDIIEYLGYN